MFFISFLKYLRGYLVIYLSGYAPERFLNMCGKRDILIWNLKSVENGYQFCMSVDAYKSLHPILRKTKTRAKIIKKVGIPFYLFRYRKRKVFVIGMILFFCLLIYVSGFVWNIEIIGNSYLSDDTVIHFLEEEGADFGTSISKINCAELEEKLRSTYPEVIWASVKIYGTKMTIELQESLLADEFYQLDSDEISDIIAAKDGVITDMITRHGTPLVSVGSNVKKGEVLVSGELIIYNDYGETIDYLYETADADIIAQVQYEYSDKISKKYQDKDYFEEEKMNYVLQIGDIFIHNPFWKAPESLYDCSEENVQLCFGENYYFPIYLRKITYYPYKIVEKEYTEEEVTKLAENHYVKYLKKLEEKGIQIIQKNVMIKKVGYSYLVTGSITARESIVSYQPTVTRNTDYTEGNIENESD